VARRLDRETKSSYSLEVAATDGVFVSRCRVSIEILDDNDSPPICARSTYEATVEENVPAGEEVLTLGASDADEGTNARQIFYLTGRDADLFHVDRDSGVVTTALPLDRERESSYALEAHVQDAGMPEMACSSKLLVKVNDVNDNAPQWPEASLTASLKEDVPVGAVATRVRAVDPDENENARVRYMLLNSAGGHFKVDAITGLVTLAKPLDREERASYNLTVRATDSGSPRLSSETTLRVTVLDVNDSPPEFASRLYFATVDEDSSLGTDVVRVFAASRDAGVNAEITYSIIGGNEHRRFRVDPKSGTVTVALALDHELAGEYSLTIQAQDGGDPPLNSRATANITVRDVNDNAPVFTQPAYAALVTEAARPGQLVATVTATDADAEDNGRVSYSVVGGDRHNQFAVGAVSGEITVASALDREMVSSYTLEVQAVDAGSPAPLSSTVLVTVDVSDANDNTPIFPEGNYTAYVQEDRPAGHLVHKFAVTDADDSPNGAPFTYDIRRGNEGNGFRIQSDGSLLTAATFNRAEKEEHVLVLRVFDHGNPPLYSDAYVTVKIIEGKL